MEPRKTQMLNMVAPQRGEVKAAALGSNSALLTSPRLRGEVSAKPTERGLRLAKVNIANIMATILWSASLFRSIALFQSILPCLVRAGIDAGAL